MTIKDLFFSEEKLAYINTKLKKTIEKFDIIDKPEKVSFISFELPSKNLAFQIRKEDFEKYKETFNLK